MSSYKFITKISKKGIIQLPDNPALFNKEVEITIVPTKHKRREKPRATEFVEKWGGFLKDVEIENSKYDYLMEKHK